MSDDIAAHEEEDKDVPKRTNKKKNPAELINFDEITMNDVDEDQNGGGVGVKGVTWDRFSAKQLRRICSSFGVKGYKHAKKNETIEILKRWCFNQKVYYSQFHQQDTSCGPPRKEVQCAFRLINILFSDNFAWEFSKIGNAATRECLDSGKATNDMYFRERVRDAFVSPDCTTTYNELHFIGKNDDGNKIFGTLHHINPASIVQHDWKKLRAIWKNVKAEYKAALSRFTLSGTHDSDFFAFCKGNLETYYLRLHLQERRPELNGMVEADLPENCFVSSDMSIAELRAKGIGGSGGAKCRVNSSSSSDKEPPSSCTEDSASDNLVVGEDHDDDNHSVALDLAAGPANKKRKIVGAKKVGSGLLVVDATPSSTNNSEVAAAIREYGHSQMRAKVAVQKLRYMEMEDSRRREKNLVRTWDKMQKTIRMLRKDLLEIVGSGNQQEVARQDIEREIEAIKKKRNQVGAELGTDHD